MGYSHGPGLQPITGLGSSNVSQQAAGGEDQQLLTKLLRLGGPQLQPRGRERVDEWKAGSQGRMVCAQEAAGGRGR